jgi:uncharacterized protein YbjT (DUF2867 family)
MDIAVTTPTGTVGRELAAMLVRAGLRPRVLVRDPARLDEGIRERVDVRIADLTDADAVVEATRGADALHWVNPPGFVEDPIAQHVAFGEVAARAVSDNRIERTVFQSSVGAELRGGAGDIDGLARTEELLDATGRSVLHLRCGYFFSNLLLDVESIRGGTVPVLVPVDQPRPWVAPRDIAEVAALRLLSTEWSGRQVQAVHGPVDLSWDDVSDILHRSTGHLVRAERVPDADMRRMLTEVGLPPATVEAVVGMSVGLRDGFTPEQPRDVTTTTPTTLEAWVSEFLVPALEAG